MTKYIIIQTQFEAVHCWPECPFDDVAFLKNKHRHIFHVTMKIKVNHNDRDVEFIQAKRELTSWLRTFWEGRDLEKMSCEDMAETLINEFDDWPIFSVSVFEDNENGAEIVF